jgi:hypothetical protein
VPGQAVVPGGGDPCLGGRQHRGENDVLIGVEELAGLSAVVSMLLILAVAGNKIQGLAAVRALGMLIAGLPCLPWFIQSGWNLAFGLLPPYWAAKAFWVASDNGIWWPYVVVGIVYNVAVAVPLFRRFLSKNGVAKNGSLINWSSVCREAWSATSNADPGEGHEQSKEPHPSATAGARLLVGGQPARRDPAPRDRWWGAAADRRRDGAGVGELPVVARLPRRVGVRVRP